MKKFLISCVVAVLSMAVQAQTFTPLLGVVKENKAFYAVDAANNRVAISAIQYARLKESGAGHDIVRYTGNDAASSFAIVVSRSEYDNIPLTVDSIGLAEDGRVEVYFNDGSKYLTKSLSWADVLVGQTVIHTTIKSPLRVFEKYEAVTEMPEGFFANKGIKPTAKNAPVAVAQATTTTSSPSRLKTAYERAKNVVKEAVESFTDSAEPEQQTYSFGNIKIIEE